jgi:hypothetical protein
MSEGSRRLGEAREGNCGSYLEGFTNQLISDRALAIWVFARQLAAQILIKPL